MTEIFPYFSLVKKSLDQCKIAKHWFWRAFKIQDTTKQGMVWLKWIIPKIAGVHDLLAERLTRQHTDGTWPGPKIRHEIQAVQETKHPTALSHPVRPVRFTNSVYVSFPRWISFISNLVQIPALAHKRFLWKQNLSKTTAVSDCQGGEIIELRASKKHLVGCQNKLICMWMFVCCLSTQIKIYSKAH